MTVSNIVQKLLAFVVKVSLQQFPKRQILDCFKQKEFADYNFSFDENGRKLSKWVENTAGQGDIAHYEHFFPFQKTSIKDTYKPGLVRKGLIVYSMNQFKVNIITMIKMSVIP